ncbi:biofilm PGA synthesis N-glycosyltransferase PgaC [Selenomonas ruminantium]|uniref:Poly-beta-1,6-N-acetyl-D-glucosamine synthase n=1 Tax=Selenomonas ruminantium TaxID=971 RepID=A0A1M6VWI8_SELRU|nr:poly-beta-1,6-N-acetyl-D-glucosamine synthase [Selenomonas ruminantium]SHK85794.1 biofilm PGA synthesis N-glycosyltransferase PgaC [Selenomonas ruminantium]
MIYTFILWLADFVFYYPVIMSLVWMVGGIYFFWRREKGKDKNPPKLDRMPLVSVFIPAHNEERDIADAVDSIFANHYKNLEVIVINDASTDNTQGVLESLMGQYPGLKVLRMEKNLGKANGLNLAFAMSHGDIIVTLDADSMLDEHAIEWAVWHFNHYPRVGAVTGNPKVRNRTSLLAKIQTAEYASVIGLIKRTQRIIGKVMTVSGVVAAWRRTAIINAGLWDNTAITDDIEMTWRMETKFWDVRYEPNMVCWMLVPETLKGIWVQRKRWAQGGIEVIRTHLDVWRQWRERRIWPVYLDYFLGIFWAYAFVICALLWVARLFFDVTGSGYGAMLPDLGNPLISWRGSVISMVCLLQFLVSILLDSRYDKKLPGIYFWVVWYPVVYWIFNALAAVVATPVALKRDMTTTAVWVSPDRGMKA